MALWEMFGKQKSPRELVHAGQYKAALKLLERELKTRKNDPAVLMLTADVHHKLGNLDEAKEFYIRVGEHYGDQGFFNKAVAMFKKALNLSPNDQAILDKLAGYNNKVPKYILDSRFLEAAQKGEVEQPPVGQDVEILAEDEHQPGDPGMEPAPPTSEGEPLPLAEESRLPQSLTGGLPDFLGEDMGANAVDIDISIEALPEEIDFDTLHDLSEELSQQFADTGERGLERLAAPKTSKKAARPAMIHQSQARAKKKKPPQEKTAPPQPQPVPSEPVAETKEQAPAPAPAPEPAAVTPNEAGEISQDGAGSAKTDKSMVFTSREEKAAQEPSSSMDFGSLDDALDSLFSSAQDQAPQREAHRKHWPIFRAMPDDLFHEFVIALDSRDFEEGAWIVKQGENGDEMFLIAYGEVEVLMDLNGEPQRIATLQEGDFFGEASLMTGSPRNASVRTMGQVNCLVLKRDDLRGLIPKYPAVIDSIKAIYKARVRQNAAR